MKYDTPITVIQGFDERSGLWFKKLECRHEGKRLIAQQSYSRQQVEDATPRFWLEEEKRLLAKLREVAPRL